MTNNENQENTTQDVQLNTTEFNAHPTMGTTSIADLVNTDIKPLRTTTTKEWLHSQEVKGKHKVTQADIDSFKSAAQTLYVKAKQLFGEEIPEQLQALVKEVKEVL